MIKSKINKKDGPKLEITTQNKRKLINASIAVIIFFLLIFTLPETFIYEARVMTSIIAFAVILWMLEPIPLGLTALIVMLLMLLFNVASMDVVFSGFSSPAIYLIVGGTMLAKAVNTTPLVQRITYLLLKKWGGTSKGLLGSLLVILQIQAFFIPATAVRTTLMLPIMTMIIDTVKAKPGSNLQKMILIGVAFGGNISGTAVMTAAVGNILTVELLYLYADVKITYFQWFLYTFPLWFLLIPALWFLLIKLYPLPKEQQSFPMIKTEMETKLEDLGKMKKTEIQCLLILVLIVGLWFTEPLHGLHPSIPALIGVVLMSLPGIGFAPWEHVVKINYNTVLLISITLSMGYALVDSTAADTMSNYLSVEPVLNILQNPLLAVIFIIILTQLFHKIISNVSTAVVTIVPIVITMAINANVDPMIIAFTAGLTSLYGFILVVETMPNVLVHSTGMISQRDFLIPGIYATIISIVLTILVATFWWTTLGIV